MAQWCAQAQEMGAHFFNLVAACMASACQWDGKEVMMCLMCIATSWIYNKTAHAACHIMTWCARCILVKTWHILTWCRSYLWIKVEPSLLVSVQSRSSCSMKRKRSMQLIRAAYACTCSL